MRLQQAIDEYAAKRKDNGNILFTNMAIYIDNNIYNQEPEIQSKCLEYMEQLYFKFAIQGKYFDNVIKDVEGDMYKWFAQWSALKLYYRYLQERKPDSECHHHLHSCISYIRMVSYLDKDMFMKLFDSFIYTDYQSMQMVANKEIQLMQTTIKNTFDEIKEVS